MRKAELARKLRDIANDMTDPGELARVHRDQGDIAAFAIRDSADTLIEAATVVETCEREHGE